LTIGADPITRDFTATVFVVADGRVLLLWHKKLHMWLPPGGHIDANELPDAAARREVREETGLEITLLQEPTAIGPVTVLARPEAILLEPIRPGHEHIDLIYFARPADANKLALTASEESGEIGWFTPEQMRTLGVTSDILWLAERALDVMRSAQSVRQQVYHDVNPARQPGDRLSQKPG